MKSLTLDDIWDIYTIHKIHSNEWTNVAHHYDLGSYPFEMKKGAKWYLKHGEMCSICMEPIHTLRNAHLTQCGHAFHKSCYALHMNYTLDEGVCPLCRHDSDYFSNKKYNCKTENFIDKVEDFWLHKEQYVIRTCDKHFLGMCDYCLDCIVYRKVHEAKQFLSKWWEQ